MIDGAIRPRDLARSRGLMDGALVTRVIVHLSVSHLLVVEWRSRPGIIMIFSSPGPGAGFN